MSELTQQRLKELLIYNQHTGEFIWIHGRQNSARAGERAGGVDVAGYRRISIDDRFHKEHRLAFLYMEGEFPPSQVDHINGDKSDNRFCNLRKADPQENNRNKRIAKNNTSGLTGVWFDKAKKVWRARISVEGKHVGLGSHRHFLHAARARKQAEIDHGFHGNHGRAAK